MIEASKRGWRKHEPSRIAAETASLFEMLTIRAVSEDEISQQRGAELLGVSYDDFDSMLHAREDQ